MLGDCSSQGHEKGGISSSPAVMHHLPLIGIREGKAPFSKSWFVQAVWDQPGLFHSCSYSTVVHASPPPHPVLLIAHRCLLRLDTLKLASREILWRFPGQRAVPTAPSAPPTVELRAACLLRSNPLGAVPSCAALHYLRYYCLD